MAAKKVATCSFVESGSCHELGFMVVIMIFHQWSNFTAKKKKSIKMPEGTYQTISGLRTVAQLSFCCPSVCRVFTKHYGHSCKPLLQPEFSDQSCCYPPQKMEFKTFYSDLSSLWGCLMRSSCFTLSCCSWNSVLELCGFGISKHIEGIVFAP